MHGSPEAYLQAHTCSHLPYSDRPIECPEDGCSRKFWTMQHLKVHAPTHKGEKPWKVVSDLNPPLGCSLNGRYSVQGRVVCRLLRNTTTVEHTFTIRSLAGTKLYRCKDPDGSISFDTNWELRAHQKNPRREPIRLLASVLPFAAHPSVFLYLEGAPSSYEGRAPTNVPIPRTQRQVFQPAERPRSALEDTQEEGNRWVFECLGEYGR